LLRNVFKILEMQFPPLLVAVLFTRYRQRIGEFMARTAVVESKPTLPATPPPDQSDQS
jgi:hypothetical protein